MGLPDTFVSFLQHAYAHATFTVHTEIGFTELVPYTRGLRQGCPMSPILFNVYFSVLESWFDKWTPDIGIHIPHADKLLRFICYADDVVLLAGSMAHLQILLNRFEQCISRLDMLINPTKSAVVMFNSENTPAGVEILRCKQGPIMTASSYCYLGIPFTSQLTWNEAAKHRSELADKSMRTVINYLKATYKRNMQVVTTHFNANIMSTMLFGCGIWGWDFMLPEKADWIHNVWQSKLSNTVSEALYIPSTTATIIIMCESGIWPMVYYAIKQAVTLAHSFEQIHSHMFECAMSIHTTDGFLQNLHALLTQLHLPTEDLPPLGEVMDVVHNRYIDMFNAMRIDPTLPHHPHRKISAYLSWMWNGKLHCRVPFHKTSVSAHEYHIGLHTRIMNATIPVNVHTHKHFTDRICPLCHQGSCDMQHVFVQCSALGHIRNHYAALLGGVAIDFPRLFKSGDPRVWEYIANMISAFKDVCQRKNPRKRSREDE